MISANATENATEEAEKTREQTERALAQSEKTAWDTHEQTEKALKLTELTIERAEITQQIRDIENSLKNFYYPLRDFMDKNSNRKQEEIAYISNNRYLAKEKTSDQFNKFKKGGYNLDNEIFKDLSEYVTQDIKSLENELRTKKKQC
ncbi:hypothetical protein MSSIH_1174 [Methanosarcina siciliae HI350]|uniref:Phosphoserine phosphatase n=2 Tax=Methanosarcina siciliae TaxID=38027 RepID=A0A0E3PC18_9EURY|nr:hypothetical protein MSSIH_1174 [Methanosarcina siciliae HI350]